MTIEIGPLLLQAVLAAIPLAVAVVALIRQVWTDRKVANNRLKLDDHGAQIGDIKRQINGGSVPKPGSGTPTD